MEIEFGIVYVLENAAMPGLIKIGRTKRGDPQIRMKELYDTPGVPVPFTCVYAAKVKNPEKVEYSLHFAFSPNRINPKREFFQMDASQVIKILQLVEIEVVTSIVEKESEQIDNDSKQAAEQIIKRRPKFNFEEMLIPVGSELLSVSNQETATVISGNLVSFRGEEMSLTRATKLCLENEYNVQPGPYWTYNGKRLREIYNDTYLRGE